LYYLSKLRLIIKEVGMLKFLEGYRTYLTLIVLVAHQILKLLQLDIDDQTLSTTIDTVLLIIAGIFRKLAKPK